MRAKVVEFDGQILPEFGVGSNFLVEQDAEVAALARNAVEFVIRMMTVHRMTAVFVNPNPGFQDVILACMTDRPTEMSFDELVAIQVELDRFERSVVGHDCLL